MPPTTRTRFHSVLQQGGALPLVQQAAEQQLSVQGRLQSPPPAVTKSPRKESSTKTFSTEDLDSPQLARRAN